MDWTAIYGLLGGACLLASMYERDHKGTCLGLLMLLSWFVSAVAVEPHMLGSLWAFAVTIPADGAIALLIAHQVARHFSIRGAVILGLFGLEMSTHVTAWLAGGFGSDLHYAIVCVIYAISVMIGGGGNVYRTVRDWGSGCFNFARADRFGG